MLSYNVVEYGAPFAVFETFFFKSQKLICTQLCLVNLFQEAFNCTLISRSFQMQFSIASNNAFKLKPFDHQVAVVLPIATRIVGTVVDG